MRRSRRPRLAAVSVFGQETALILGCSRCGSTRARSASSGPAARWAGRRWIWHLERVLHLPSETTLQQVFLPHPLIIQFFNLYYSQPALRRC